MVSSFHLRVQCKVDYRPVVTLGSVLLCYSTSSHLHLPTHTHVHTRQTDRQTHTRWCVCFITVQFSYLIAHTTYNCPTTTRVCDHQSINQPIHLNCHHFVSFGYSQKLTTLPTSWPTWPRVILTRWIWALVWVPFTVFIITITHRSVAVECQAWPDWLCLPLLWIRSTRPSGSHQVWNEHVNIPTIFFYFLTQLIWYYQLLFKCNQHFCH